MRKENRNGEYKAPDDIFDLNDLDELQDFESYEEYAAYMRGLEAGRTRVFHQEPGNTGHLYDVSDDAWEREEERSGRKARMEAGKAADAGGRANAGVKAKAGANGRTGGKARPADHRKERGHFPFGLVVLLLLLAIVGAGLFYVYTLFSGIHTVENPGAFSARLRDGISDKVRTDPFMTGYTNIALFGVDSRDSELLSGNNRSDIIMILSINNLNGNCRLLSLYRDTYLDVGGGVYTKCNAAYAYGGPEQAVRMLNENLDLNITDFVTIGFGGLADLIDAVGGVEIEVAEEEVHGINDYQSTMASELGREYIPVQGPGYQTLTGLQAVAYCRIRYTAGDDFRRTQRQREVLMQTFRKAKHISPDMIRAVTDNVFDETATSVTAAEAVPLAIQLLRMDIADTGGFPTETLRTTGIVSDQDCIIPVTLEENVKWLHAYLFEDTAYEVSDRVSTISAQIRANTGR